MIPLAMAVLIGLAVLILVRPEVGLVLCLVAAPLAKGIAQPYLGPVDLTVFLFVVTAGSILVRLVGDKRRITLPKTNFNVLVLLFITLLLASLLYTPLPQYGLTIFLRFALLDVSILYLTFMWAVDQGRIKRLLSLFAWIGLAYGAIMFIVIFLIPNGLISSHQVRAVLATTAPISAALILALSILIALTFMITQPIRRFKRLALIALIVLSTAELIAMNTRGPLIAFVVGLASLLVILLRSWEWRRYAMLGVSLLIGSGIVALYILPSQYIARYALILDPTSSSIHARLNAWKFVANHFYDWFWSGAGLFGFPYYYTGKTTGLSIFGSYPHNLLLDVFADSGIFGVGLFISIIGYLLLKGWRVAKEETPSRRILGIASYSCLIAFLTSLLFSGSLIGTRPLWFIGGCILSLWKLRLERYA